MNRHIKKISSIFKYPKKQVEYILTNLCDLKEKEYIAIYNPEYVGIMNATKELFDNTIGISEIFNMKAVNDIANKIVKLNINQVIFASMAYGYKALAEKIYELDNSIVIKFMWHGSHSLFVNRDEEYFLNSILDLEKRGIVKKIGFIKESMAKFYKIKGYDTCFVKNTVHSLKDYKTVENRAKETTIGIYSSGDRWEKNTYNQLSACSLIGKDVLVDILPNTPLAVSYCKLMNIKQIPDSPSAGVPRDELIKRMAKNTINLYVTFTECAPVIPLESMEVGVPCLVGDNNHYFNGTELEQYLVVKAEDSIDEIATKAKLCIENREKIITLYRKWKSEYDKESIKSVEEFLSI